MKATQEQINWIMMGVTIAAVLCALYVGHQVGLRKGMTVVTEFKDEYMKNYCDCWDPPDPQYGFDYTNINYKEENESRTKEIK